MLVHIIKSVKWMWPIIGILSVSEVALVVLLFMDLRMGDSVPPAFVEDFTDVVNKRQFKQAYDIAKEDGSFLARVITAGMGRLQYGLEDARQTALNMVESIRSGKEQLISYLATIGTLGPLCGLVGTVYGMIETFRKMSASVEAPQAKELAGPLSHGLVVTLLGIGLSVPAIFFHAFFRNRLLRISMDVSNISDDLLTQMYHNSRRPAAPTTAPVPVPLQSDARPASAATIKPAE
jgi:biopolymer transport protein ExbB